MSAKHTPGPWVFRDMRKWKGASSFYISAPFGRDQRSPNVALIPNSTIHETEANARLIAAAPELLEALKDAYPYIDNDHLRTRIGNLIAKAQGGSV